MAQRKHAHVIPSLFVFFVSHTVSHVRMDVDSLSSRCRQAVQLKGALESLSSFTLGTTVAVEVTRDTTANPNSFFYTVTFLSPHGDIPQLSFDTTAYVARAGAGALACHTSHTNPAAPLPRPCKRRPSPIRSWPRQSCPLLALPPRLQLSTPLHRSAPLLPQSWHSLFVLAPTRGSSQIGRGWSSRGAGGSARHLGRDADVRCVCLCLALP